MAGRDGSVEVGRRLLFGDAGARADGFRGGQGRSVFEASTAGRQNTTKTVLMAGSLSLLEVERELS